MSISTSLVLRVAALLSLAQFASSVALPARCGPIRCAASSAPRRAAAALDRALIGLEPSDGVVLVDVENVRGKSGFTLGHEELLGEAARWAQHRNLHGRVVLVVDHGARTAAYYLRQLGLAVAFSGRRQSADDMIAKQVPYVQRQLARDVCVVTGDVGLKTRCQQKSVHGRSLSTVESASLLDAFDEAARTEEPLPALAPLVARAPRAAAAATAAARPAAWRPRRRCWRRSTARCRPAPSCAPSRACSKRARARSGRS